MFIMFSESALKIAKTMKQRCSALITSGTSTRDVTLESLLFLMLKHTWRQKTRDDVIVSGVDSVVLLDDFNVHIR